MSAELAKKEPQSASPDSTDKQRAEELLAHGVDSRKSGDRQAAIHYYAQAVRQAQTASAGDLICRAATYLGLMELEQGNLQSALHWLDQARTAAAQCHPPAWLSLLSTLAGVSRAQAAAEGAERQLAQTRLQLAKEISLLQSQVKEVTAELIAELKREPPSGHAGRVTTSASKATAARSDRLALTVRALGHFEARLADDTAIVLCSNRRGQALFKVLATEPHARRHKETFLLLFWPDEVPVVAAGKLHIAASRLRQSLFQAGLGRNALLFEDDCYFLNSELQVRSDVVLFNAHFQAGQRLTAMDEPGLAAAEYEEALAFYQGPYLADVVGEDWPLAERSRLEEQFLTLLTKLAAWHFDKGRYAQSAECCQQILKQDALREDIYRQRMRCLSRDGQRNQALRLYQDCVRVLREELAVEPMPETTELFEQIQQGQAA